MGNVGSDIHSVANILLEKELVEKSFLVRNLGVAVPIGEWVEAFLNFHPNLLLIGSMNGDLEPVVGLIQEVKAINSFHCEILVGGNLKLGSNGGSIAPLLRKMGVQVIGGIEEPSFASISNLCLDLTSRFKKNSFTG